MAYQGSDLDLDDSAALTTEYFYDAHGRTVRTTRTGADGTSVTTQTRYDNHGRVVAESDPYDEVLLDVSWSVSDNSFVDGAGHLIPTKCREYDAAGRLIAVVLPAVDDPEDPDSVACPRYEYTYDAYGNHVATRDNIRQTYDVSGNPLIFYDHDGTAGNVVED